MFADRSPGVSSSSFVRMEGNMEKGPKHRRHLAYPSRHIHTHILLTSSVYPLFSEMSTIDPTAPDAAANKPKPSPDTEQTNVVNEPTEGVVNVGSLQNWEDIAAAVSLALPIGAIPVNIQVFN